MEASKRKGIVLQVVAYTVAIAVALGVGHFCGEDMHPLLKVLWADIAGTLVIFGFSLAFHNSSFYDPYWSVAPAVIVTYYALSDITEGADMLRLGAVFVLVQCWSWRLTFNFLRGWKGLHQQDWRYDDLKEKSGKWFPLVDLFGIQLFPTLMVYAGCLPLFYIASSGVAFGVLDVVAGIITAGAILIEFIADNQLRRFVLAKKRPGDTLTSGLWAYSRHPNYFGEMMFWWGLFLFGVAAAPAVWWQYIAGAVIITGLFFFISVPLIDARMMKRREKYQAIKDKIPAIIPWFPKK